MTTPAERVVDRYLEDLERSMPDVPKSRREEIVADIVGHIDDALGELGREPTEADVLNVLDRVGTPDEIATDARERLGVRRRRISAMDPVALVLLLVGGFVFFVGWIVGVVLLWASDVWTARDKIIGTLVFPGGLLLPFLLAFGAGATETCHSSGTGPEVCTGGPSAVAHIAWIVLFVVLVLAPFATTAYLARRMRRRSAVALA
jgi:hypothetical protein